MTTPIKCPNCLYDWFGTRPNYVIAAYIAHYCKRCGKAYWWDSGVIEEVTPGECLRRYKHKCMQALNTKRKQLGTI